MIVERHGELLRLHTTGAAGDGAAELFEIIVGEILSLADPDQKQAFQIEPGRRHQFQNTVALALEFRELDGTLQLAFRLGVDVAAESAQTVLSGDGQSQSAILRNR